MAVNTKSIHLIIASYSKELSDLHDSDLHDLIVIERGLEVSRNTIRKLRRIVVGKTFNNLVDEINFFKSQKPFIFGRIKFFLSIYNYNLKKVVGSIKSQKHQLNMKIKSLQKDHLQDLDFVKYYRRHSTFLDNYYFVRGNENNQLGGNDYGFYLDEEFSTSHDTNVANIMAYDLSISYYTNLLKDLDKPSDRNTALKRHFKSLKLGWTANKIDLIELIYALQASGSIKGGKAGIKDMAMACEQIFDMDLGNFYRKFLEIRGRKIETTKYLDRLKRSLLKRIEEADD
ncbi:RteC domain-containing protein [uncultured Croceitalea sp.]|uniref:RteC domain-containing protein n=1 Tax=uncultured Croceitalea sp. TaxID=1798908 RepID=UPI0033055C84